MYHDCNKTPHRSFHNIHLKCRKSKKNDFISVLFQKNSFFLLWLWFKNIIHFFVSLLFLFWLRSWTAIFCCLAAFLWQSWNFGTARCFSFAFGYLLCILVLKKKKRKQQQQWTRVANKKEKVHAISLHSSSFSFCLDNNFHFAFAQSKKTRNIFRQTFWFIKSFHFPN